MHWFKVQSFIFFRYLSNFSIYFFQYPIFINFLLAKKRKDSPHGVNTSREPEGSESIIEGAKYAPKVCVNPISKEKSLGPYY